MIPYSYMKGHKVMAGVEYIPEDKKDNGIINDSTYEIFPTLDDAFAFAKRIGKLNVLQVFVADFNRKRVFKENKYWNYEDCSDTYTNRVKIR